MKRLTVGRRRRDIRSGVLRVVFSPGVRVVCDFAAEPSR
jgi:hypothetical protein